MATIASDFEEFGKKSYEQRLGLPARVPLITASVVHILMESNFDKILTKLTKETFPSLEKEFQEKAKDGESAQSKEYYDKLVDGVKEEVKKQFTDVLDSVEVCSVEEGKLTQTGPCKRHHLGKRYSFLSR